MKKRIGYKATYNFQCNDLTYEIGKTYEISSIEICNHGFHYCPKIKDVLYYYNADKDLKILEIEDIGDERIEDDDKICTNKIKVIREVPAEEHKLFKVDKNNNIIYSKDPYGYEEWYEYDKKGNLIYYKDSDGFEEWKEYDEKGNVISYKNNNNKNWKITIK